MRTDPNPQQYTLLLIRLTSTDQWHIVKESLERLLVMEVYDADSLESTLIFLKNIVFVNSNISCILVDNIDTFYQQVRP
jgi:hypothetical protein